MDVNMRNTASQIIEIEDDVINLDEADRTPEEVIYEWDAMVRKKLSMFGVADNENILGDLMKEYLQSLQEMVSSYDDSETLKRKVFCHITFLYSYCVELQCCTPDSYLNSMENILTLYCNLELNIIQPLKKKDLSKHKYKKRIVSATRRILHMLTVYLLEQHDHILHVLIKVNTSKQVSHSCSEVLNVLYMHFLTKVPAFNFSDESFCRNYVAFQKWKEIRNKEDWGGMDKIMYKMFKRTPESIQNNKMLRHILMPICYEEVDILSNVFCSYRAICKAYFKHMMSKTTVEIENLDFDIDLGEDEATVPQNNEDDEEIQLLKMYHEVERSMCELSDITSVSEVDVFRKCKEELDDDDDVQVVNITRLQTQSLLDIANHNEDNDSRRMSNEDHIQTEQILDATSSVSRNCSNETNFELEKLNGINRICVGAPITVGEACNVNSSQTSEVQNIMEPVDQGLCSINNMELSYNVGINSNQLKVSFTSDTHPMGGCGSTNITNEETVQVKNSEVQANNLQNIVYNDYGLTTPPSDVPIDEQIEMHCLYTTINQQHKKDFSSEKGNTTVITKTSNVQMDLSDTNKTCQYNNYGLTPPNDTQIEDFNLKSSQRVCVYPNVGHQDLMKGKVEENFNECLVTNICDNKHVGVAQKDLEFNYTIPSSSPGDPITKDYQKIQSYVPSEHEEFGDQLDILETRHGDARYNNENVNIDSSHGIHTNRRPVYDKTNNHSESSNYSDKGFNMQIPMGSRSRSKITDQIDTGQEILNCIKNDISVIKTKNQILKNGNRNRRLKSSISSKIINGQTNDINKDTSTEIVSESKQNCYNTTKGVHLEHKMLTSSDSFDVEFNSESDHHKQSKPHKQGKTVTFQDPPDHSRNHQISKIDNINAKVLYVALGQDPSVEKKIAKMLAKKKKSLIRVDYDKTTSKISNTDKVYYQENTMQKNLKLTFACLAKSGTVNVGLHSNSCYDQVGSKTSQGSSLRNFTTPQISTLENPITLPVNNLVIHEASQNFNSPYLETPHVSGSRNLETKYCTYSAHDYSIEKTTGLSSPVTPNYSIQDTAASKPYLNNKSFVNQVDFKIQPETALSNSTIFNLRNRHLLKKLNRNTETNVHFDTEEINSITSPSPYSSNEEFSSSILNINNNELRQELIEVPHSHKFDKYRKIENLTHVSLPPKKRRYVGHKYAEETCWKNCEENIHRFKSSITIANRNVTESEEMFSKRPLNSKICRTKIVTDHNFYQCHNNFSNYDNLYPSATGPSSSKNPKIEA